MSATSWLRSTLATTQTERQRAARAYLEDVEAIRELNSSAFSRPSTTSGVRDLLARDVDAIKELIEARETRVAALEQRNSRLEAQVAALAKERDGRLAALEQQRGGLEARVEALEERAGRLEGLELQNGRVLEARVASLEQGRFMEERDGRLEARVAAMEQREAEEKPEMLRRLSFLEADAGRAERTARSVGDEVRARLAQRDEAAAALAHRAAAAEARAEAAERTAIDALDRVRLAETPPPPAVLQERVARLEAQMAHVRERLDAVATDLATAAHETAALAADDRERVARLDQRLEALDAATDDRSGTLASRLETLAADLAFQRQHLARLEVLLPPPFDET